MSKSVLNVSERTSKTLPMWAMTFGERLGDCCIESIRPFEGMIDGFLDTLTTFDWGLKTTVDAWLWIHSHLAGRCYSQCELLRNINIVRNMSKYLLW